MNKPIVRRMSHEDRFKFLIYCTFQCIAEKGLQKTTIREIAERANVTYGLLRHYFPNKDVLLETTYRCVTEEMTSLVTTAAQKAGPSYKDKLTAFITATLSPPFVSREHLAFWSSYVNRNITDENSGHSHKIDGYATYRLKLKDLIRHRYIEQKIEISDTKLHYKMIQLNSFVDGLWIEACLSLENLKDEELIEMGLEAVESILVVKPNH